VLIQWIEREEKNNKKGRKKKPEKGDDHTQAKQPHRGQLGGQHSKQAWLSLKKPATL
jgi:hypothetical protein